MEEYKEPMGGDQEVNNGAKELLAGRPSWREEQKGEA